MKGLKLSALISAIALSLPTVALAQTTPADRDYINDLFNFLENEDAITYELATQAMSPEDSVWAAQMFCETFSAGVSPAAAFSVYTSAAIGEASNQGASITDEMAYAVGLYGGAVMNIGSTHYCPQYQTQVEQALRSIGTEAGVDSLDLG